MSGVWNLKLNKAKSQVLTEENITDIAGIPCATPLPPREEDRLHQTVPQPHQQHRGYGRGSTEDPFSSRKHHSD